MFNLIACLIALILGIIWFYYVYKLTVKNEELETRILHIRLCLIAGNYKKAKELTEIDYQYIHEEV